MLGGKKKKAKKEKGRQVFSLTKCGNVGVCVYIHSSKNRSFS